MSLCFDTLDASCLVYFQAICLLHGVCGESQPLDLFLLFGDDVHGHEDVEGVVNTPPDVLLVVLLVSRRGTPGKESGGVKTRLFAKTVIQRFLLTSILLLTFHEAPGKTRRNI